MKKPPAKWCIAALLAHSLMAVSLLSRADPSPSPNAQDDRSVTLTHSEPDADEKDQTDPSKLPPLTGGGFVRRINKITRDMNATGGGTTTTQQSNTSSADLPITVTPNIVQHKDQWTATMSVKGTPQLEIDSAMAATSQMQCLADKINTLSNIGSWTHVLTKQEVDAMQSHYSVDLDASQVFADNVLLSKPKLVLTIRYKPVHIDPMVVYDQPMRLALQAKQAELGDAAAKLLAAMAVTRAELERSTSIIGDVQKGIDQRAGDIATNQASLDAANQQLEATKAASGWNPKYDPMQAQVDPNVSSGYQKEMLDRIQAVAKLTVKSQKLDAAQKADNDKLTRESDFYKNGTNKLTDQQAQYGALMKGVIDVLDHPVIKQVDVTADGELVCQKVYDPDAGTIELRRLQANANAATAAVDRAKKIFDKAKQLYDEAAKAAIDSGNKLADAIRANGWGQFKVGMLANAFDVAWAMRNGGTAGAVLELASKVAEFGQQYLLDTGYGKAAQSALGISSDAIYDDIYNDLRLNPDDPTSPASIAKQSQSVLFQEGVVGIAKKKLAMKTGAWLEQHIADDVKSNMQQIGGKPSYWNGFEDAAARLETVEAKVADLKSPAYYKLKDAGITIAKEAVKTGLSKYYQAKEQAAWEDYYTKELRSRALYPFYKIAAVHYWDAMDWMTKADADLAAYQKAHPFPATPFFKTTVDKNFREGANVVVTATLANPPTPDMVFDCTLQKETLPRTGPATFSEKLPAYVTREIEGRLSLKLK